MEMLLFRPLFLVFVFSRLYTGVEELKAVFANKYNKYKDLARPTMLYIEHTNELHKLTQNTNLLHMYNFSALQAH